MHGPCSVWDVDLEDGCCNLPDGTDETLIAAKQELASESLWASSGRRWGLCEVTVRPCLRTCDGGAWNIHPYWPYRDGEGEWRNLASCACIGTCSCSALCEIVLDGPVASVEQVLIDGTELMAENYRLDIVGGQYRLLRTDGGCWPSCSDITADCDEEGAFCVTYMKGLALTDLAIAAASELTCEYVKACLPDCKTCRLPKNVQAVVRQGVAVTFDTATEWIGTLPMVNAFLSAVNPKKLAKGGSVWSPDIPETRLTVTAEGS